MYRTLCLVAILAVTPGTLAIALSPKTAAKSPNGVAARAGMPATVRAPPRAGMPVPAPQADPKPFWRYMPDESSIIHATPRPAAGRTLAASAPVLNVGAIYKIVAMQLLIGWTIFNGGAGAEVLSSNAHLNLPSTWLVGAVGALPLIALGRAVETSDAPGAADINSATNRLVLNMLGARPQPLFALAVALALGALVGTVEETLFRGQVLPTLVASAQAKGWEHGDALVHAVAASGLLFGAAHLNVFAGPKALVTAETAATLGLQSASGLWFGILACVGSGSLGAPIVAHGLYDAYTIYSTHVSLTNQVRQAGQRALHFLSEPAAMKWERLRGADWVRSGALLFHLLDVNGDGEIDEAELRVGGPTHGLPDEAMEALRAALRPGNEAWAGEPAPGSKWRGLCARFSTPCADSGKKEAGGGEQAMPSTLGRCKAGARAAAVPGLDPLPGPGPRGRATLAIEEFLDVLAHARVFRQANVAAWRARRSTKRVRRHHE